MTFDLVFTGGGRARPLVIVRRRGAKAVRLSIDPRDACVRLSLPLRAPLRPAIVWAAGKRPWIEAQLAKLPDGEPIVPGMAMTVGGADVVLDWHVAYARNPVLAEGVLRVGGPIEQMPGRVLRFLKRHALDVLTRETQALAKVHDIEVRSVGVGDPRSRWGSCAVSGNIRFSWRLILAPSHVRLATVAHEVAHRIHMNHGADFHDLVTALLGADPGSARRWLRVNGTALHRFGCGND